MAITDGTPPRRGHLRLATGDEQSPSPGMDWDSVRRVVAVLRTEAEAGGGTGRVWTCLADELDHFTPRRFFTSPGDN